MPVLLGWVLPEADSESRIQGQEIHWGKASGSPSKWMGEEVQGKGRSEQGVMECEVPALAWPEGSAAQ